MSSSNKLQNQIAIVTGAASGIGRAIATRFCYEGARVICADLVPLSAAATESQATHDLLTTTYGAHAAIYVQCDVTSEREIEALVARAVAWGGRLDIMVNNAGIAPSHRRIHDTDVSMLEAAMAVNIRGTFLGCKHAVGQFLKQETQGPNWRGDPTRGWIINTASAAGLVGFKNVSATYVSTKHAVVGLTRQVAIDYAADRIHCNCLCPGFVDTAMLAPTLARLPGGAQGLGALHPWGNIGTGEDIARAAVFLASDDAAFVTGHALAIDGGYTAA